MMFKIIAMLTLCLAISFVSCDSSEDAKQPAGETETEADVSNEPANPLIFPGEKYFANMRQLTFDGENAEAYFSADGTKLILQRTERGAGCDQIYVMDIASGEMELVSRGGTTTCSYFQYPNDDKIIYASTHLAGEECPEKYSQAGGFVWTLHPEYDIFRADPDGSNLEPLTDGWGYEAEGTYAHDGSAIVYTSLLSGDLELWVMNPDGSGKTQMTDRFGYDGGAFYSWDSTKIVWRSFYPETDEEIKSYRDLLADNAISPGPMQVWVMDADGANKIQVTDNGAMNFCPFFAPGDDRIIYTSLHGAQARGDFNLWIVDIDGENQEQVSFYVGFDAFPMFSPDGTKLVFGSARNAEMDGEYNIFICDWVE